MIFVPFRPIDPAAKSREKRVSISAKITKEAAKTQRKINEYLAELERKKRKERSSERHLSRRAFEHYDSRIRYKTWTILFPPFPRHL